jgi:hypothetical protein
MSIVTSCSRNSDAAAAVEEIRAAFAGVTLRLVVFFCSSAFVPANMAMAMQQAFPKIPVIGCTTAGEIISGAMLKNSLVAMALDDSILEQVDVRVVNPLNRDSTVQEAFAGFEKTFGQSLTALDMAHHVGLILADGLSGAEEAILDDIGNRSNLPFIGGSAGDDLAFKATHVFAEGRAWPNAAVIAVLKTRRPYAIVKTQSFKTCPAVLTPTRADHDGRLVQEFNHRPATEAYAAAIGTTVDALPDMFMHHPVGLMIDGDPFVRSPQQIKGTDIAFYCQVKPGMELSLLESTDIVADTNTALAKAQAEGPIAGILNFHCILRTLELEQKKQTEAYGKLFAAWPTIGFSTYGEAYIGHINQTATMLIFR